MPFKIAACLASLALLLSYFGPVLLKLKEIPLGVVLLGGLVVVLVDLWETLSGD